MWILRWILSALVILVILGFALQNQEQVVSVRIVNWTSPNMPLYFYLYISFAAGILLWAVISALNVIRLKGEIHRVQRENKKVREELDRLRNITILEEDEEKGDIGEPDQTVAE